MYLRFGHACSCWDCRSSPSPLFDVHLWPVGRRRPCLLYCICTVGLSLHSPTSLYLHSHLWRVTSCRHSCSPSLSHPNAHQQGEAKLGVLSSNVMETASPPKKDLPCKYCQRRFRRLEHVQRHERTHTKETPYKCTCGRSFSRRYGAGHG